MAQISDPRAMRALAHPLRIQLLEMVIARGTATATELAEALGQSPSNCSFHLRKLAEFGYLERAAGEAGREKPWRATDPLQDLAPDPGDPEALQAATAAGAAVREWDFARMQAADGRRNPAEWRGATFQHGATMIVTPDEARKIARGIAALLAPFHARLTDPALRPPGAGAVRFFAATTYLPEYQEQLDERRSVAEPGTDPARSRHPRVAAGPKGRVRS